MNKDVQKYIDAVTDERKALFGKLHDLIVDVYPDAEILIWYGVPTYRAKLANVCLAYWKDGVSLSTNDADHIAAFKVDNPTIKTGKVSINFKVRDTLPMPAIKQVVKHAIEAVKQA